MNLEWLNNDTIALIGLVLIACGGLVTGIESVVSVAVGAIGGFIGSKVLSE